MNSWTVWALNVFENKIQRGRLRWFGHVERKEENNWVKKCTRMNVIGVVDRGAPRKTWRSCVKRDMKAMGIKEEMAQDRCAWRNITGGPTRASADAWNTECVLGSRTLNEYDDDDNTSSTFLFFPLLLEPERSHGIKNLDYHCKQSLPMSDDRLWPEARMRDMKAMHVLDCTCLLKDLWARKINFNRVSKLER